MLRTLSYFNLIFSVIYFLVYLQNGGFGPVTALLGVVVFSWLVLRGQERGESKWSVLQWAAGLLSIAFAVLTAYGAAILILDAIEYQYYPPASILLSGTGVFFVVTIFVQVLIALSNNYSKKSNQPFDN